MMICHDLSISTLVLLQRTHLNRRLPFPLEFQKRFPSVPGTPTSWQNPKLRNHPPRKATDVLLHPCNVWVIFLC